jgi:VIT1/CCC1 family predicted Fe2+/Mn2+ transporter
MAAFTVGALLPVAAILLSPPSIAFYVTLVAVAWALGGTGHLSAKLGGAAVVPAIARNIGGGMFAMIVTHLIGLAVGTQIG